MHNRFVSYQFGFALLGIMLAASSAGAQQANTEELAKKLANPISSLISVPFQNTYNCCFGPNDAGRYTLNIQPVVPFSVNDNWMLIFTRK